jgi:hypothetical protein
VEIRCTDKDMVAKEEALDVFSWDSGSVIYGEGVWMSIASGRLAVVCLAGRAPFGSFAK